MVRGAAVVRNRPDDRRVDLFSGDEQLRIAQLEPVECDAQ
jgi:hypothetical protein